MKELSIAIFLFFIPNFLFSQSDYKLSVFNLNPIHFNPAYSGTLGELSAVGVHSSQFTNFEKSPRTQFLGLQYFIKDKNIGLGLDISNDQFGIVKENNINSNISYILRLNENFRLSFGIKAGFKSILLDYSHLNIFDPDEDVFLEGFQRHTIPNLGFGLFIVSEEFNFGISSPTFYTQDYKNIFTNKFSPELVDYYATVGYNRILNSSYTLQSNILARVVDGAPYSAMIALSVEYEESILIGANFELDSSIGSLIGFKIFDNFYAGYAIDFSINNFQKYNSGSHNFFLSYGPRSLRNSDL
ncbi:PorP/SprF family type IX secretion system membrane protein [Cyclobacterium qasimii]|uniref:Membrane protein n=1 Tax=Cyclobacterium qasimii TaxID=1350429 RepID=A0A512C7M6_9BACT|nr:PorP/SprF family type IX secretion system membrane protein [Cyclobacterium qasimii]GEO20232.1 membrane protein [Cyclobacterium qasimii]